MPDHVGTKKADHSIWVEKQSYGNIEHVHRFEGDLE